jgi:hypothetical protein
MFPNENANGCDAEDMDNLIGRWRFWRKFRRARPTRFSKLTELQAVNYLQHINITK